MINYIVETFIVSGHKGIILRRFALPTLCLHCAYIVPIISCHKGIMLRRFALPLVNRVLNE